MILSVDPATHGCGCALWRRNDGILFRAGYVANDVNCGGLYTWVRAAQMVVSWLSGMSCSELIVEMPQVYTRGENKTKGDPNKCVIPLVAVDAALAALLPHAVVNTYQPHTWKGSTSKPEKASGPEYIIMSRVKERLSSEELSRVHWPKSVVHSWDVADAIGVGLHHLGRFERHRTFPRE